MKIKDVDITLNKLLRFGADVAVNIVRNMGCLQSLRFFNRFVMLSKRTFETVFFSADLNNKV